MALGEDSSEWSMAAPVVGGKSAAATRNAESSVGAPVGAKRRGEREACGDSVIGNGCRIKGTLETKGNARIEGIVEGEIISEGELTIGEEATVRANVTAERLKVFGSVTGDISCSERVEAFSGGKIIGNIYSPRVALHDGVVFDGNCRMEKPASGIKSAI